MRVILAIGAFAKLQSDPINALVLYTVSALLDAVDGYFARLLNQCSNFGAVLDMITDRVTFACLLSALAVAYPTYAAAFQFVIALDFASHWVHMYS